MKTIKLSQGKVAQVDDEDYERASHFNWHASKSGRVYYAKRRAVIDGKVTTQTLHAFILGRKQGGPIIDHKDRDGLNCQKFNLRFCSKAENSRNASPGKKQIFKI